MDATSLYNRKEGTFLNPPPSSEAIHCIWFWSNVTIPDAIALGFRSAWATADQKRLNEHLDSSYKSWWAQAKAQYPNATTDQLQAGWVDHRDGEQMIQNWRQDNPEAVLYEASQLIRALMMRLWVPDDAVYPEEYQKVMDHLVEICSGHYTVSELVDRYHLMQHRDLVTAVPIQLSHQTNRQSLDPIVNEIRTMHASLAELLDGMGDTLIDTHSQGMTTSY